MSRTIISKKRFSQLQEREASNAKSDHGSTLATFPQTKADTRETGEKRLI